MFDDFDDFNPWGDDNSNTNIEESLAKFRQIDNGKSVYFSEEEIEALSYYFFENSKFKEQLKIIEYGLYLYPNKVDLLIEKASVLSMDNRYEEALECIEYAKNFEPYNPVIHKMEGEILCDLDRPYDAEDSFKAALMHADNDEEELIIEIYINYAQMLSQDNRVDKANAMMEKALKRFPGNEQLYYQLSMNFIANGQYDNAIAYFKNLIDADPYSHLAWYHLGRFYELTRRKTLAMSAYEYSGLANKNSRNAFFSLATLYENKGEFEKAIDNYIHCLNAGTDPYAHICIARCYLGLDQPEHARLSLRKAKDLENMVPEYHYLLGYSWLADEEPAKALPHFKKVYKNDKTDFPALKGILSCYCEMDRIRDISNMYFQTKSENHEMLLENWKEMASVLYIAEADDALDDLFLEVKESGAYKSELECVIDIIKYDQQPSEVNKDRIISGLIHNFDDTLESVKLFCHRLYEEDKAFRNLIEIYRNDNNDEQ